MRRAWLLLPLLLAAAAPACGGDDEGDGDGTGADAAPGGDEDAGNRDGGNDGEPDGGTSAMLCGGRTDLRCADTEYCDWDGDSCGASDAPGACRPRPDNCAPRREPVCGCDGLVYDSPCEANLAGSDVAASNTCLLRTAP